nr:hypothetical protein B0A51_07551 [Rachicladosporium sp. CCFEE 5018]
MASRKLQQRYKAFSLLCGPDAWWKLATDGTSIESLPDELLLSIVALAATPASQAILPTVQFALLRRGIGLVSRRFYRLIAVHFFIGRECRITIYPKNYVAEDHTYPQPITGRLGPVIRTAHMTGEWTRFGSARSFATNLNIRHELGRDTPGSKQQLLHEAGQLQALHELLVRYPHLSLTKVVFCMLRQLPRAASRIERLARSVLDVAESVGLGLQQTVDFEVVVEIRQYFELFLEEARFYREATWTVRHAED